MSSVIFVPGVGLDGVRAEYDYRTSHHMGAPAPAPVRRFCQHPDRTAAGIPNSTEQAVTYGPATGGSNVFQAECTQCIEE